MLYSKTGDESTRQNIDSLIGKMYPPYRWDHYKEAVFAKYLEKLSSGAGKSVKELKAILHSKDNSGGGE